MQKFTIFTIIISVIVLSMTTELVVQDYLKKLWPPVISANILKQIEAEPTDLTPESNETAQDESDQNNAETPEVAEPSTETETTEDLLPSSDPEPSQDLTTDEQSAIASNQPETPSSEAGESLGTETQISERVLDLLPTIDFGVIAFQPINFDRTVFGLLQAENVNPDTVALGQLIRTDQEAQTSIGAMYEFVLPNQADARRLYVNLKAQAQDFVEIDVNETNQFGQNSFYLNHQAKVAEVFVVTIRDNRVYALAYKAALHETMKPFLGLLVGN